MQLDNVTDKKYRGSWDCAKTLVKNHGVKMLYTGYVVNNIREIIFCSVYFGAYEHAKNLFSQFLNNEPINVNTAPSHISPLAVLFAGGNYL